MACKKRCDVEPRKPRRTPDVGTVRVRYTATEAMMGKPGNGTMLEPKFLLENHEPGGHPLYVPGVSYQA